MKKLLVMAMAFMLVLSLNSTFVFATDSKIDSVAELKKQISENMKDGSLSVNEKEYLKANTDERVVAQFASEKLDKAVDILNGKETTAMETKADGTLYSKEKTDFIGNDFYCNNFLYQTSLEFRLNKLKSFAQSAGVTNTTILNNFDKID